MTVVIIDNRDSFTYNLAQYVSGTGKDVRVVDNTASIREITRLEPSHLVLASGPGHVARARTCGVTFAVLERWAGRLPILGVCLGHQAISWYLGADVRPCPNLRHGFISAVHRGGRSSLLRGLPWSFPAMRYHSFAVDHERLPPEVRRTGFADDDGELMAIEDNARKLYGVQFHPESVGTPTGPRILRNFLNLTMTTGATSD